MAHERYRRQTDDRRTGDSTRLLKILSGVVNKGDWKAITKHGNTHAVQPSLVYY